jgi:hypothetical protein
VGNLIDFYNIQYSGNALNQYATYDELFIKSSAPNTKTSVKELIGQGIKP